MKKSILFSLIIIFIVGCGSESNSKNENNYQEINYTSFDGNISSLIPPPLPSKS